MKKGFTIIEIVLSIGLIVLVGTVSILSFNLVKKNNIKSTLNKMSEEIYNAVNLYVETNSEVKHELYNNSNGIKIPLTTLENAGLVDFGNLTDEDIEDEYVVTMLGTTEEDDDHCANTYTAKSWDIKSGETIYICEKSNGSQNLVTVAGDADNLSKAKREQYWFKGVDPSNYIQLNGTGTKYRIIYIDKDDSLVIGHSNNTELSKEIFSNNTLPIYGITSGDQKIEEAKIVWDELLERYVFVYLEFDRDNEFTMSVVDNMVQTSFQDYINTLLKDSYYQSNYNSYYASYMGQIQMANDYSPTYYKIHLKPCMKITGGTGDFATPYILENNC